MGRHEDDSRSNNTNVTQYDGYIVQRRIDEQHRRSHIDVR